MNSFKFIKAFFALFFLFIVGALMFQAKLVVDAKNRGEKIYHIEVNSFNGSEIYTTTNFTKDKESGCITFKDIIGIKRIVCNNYTITEY